MSYFTSAITNLINSLLDARLVDPGSALIHIGAYDPIINTKFTVNNTLKNNLNNTPMVNISASSEHVTQTRSSAEKCPRG